jgi:hypothetical protein
MVIELGDDRLPERFWSKVQVDQVTGCWVWTRAKGGGGYGAYQLGRGIGMRGAHIVAYCALVGPVPNGLQLDHLCRNRPCCNPMHLEPVTGRENIIRGVGPGLARERLTRNECPNDHPYVDGSYWIDSRGKRRCRKCFAARQGRYKSSLLGPQAAA